MKFYVWSCEFYSFKMYPAQSLGFFFFFGHVTSPNMVNVQYLRVFTKKPHMAKRVVYCRSRTWEMVDGSLHSNQDPVPERCNNSIPGINVPYSGKFMPGIELLHFSGTGPRAVVKEDPPPP